MTVIEGTHKHKNSSATEFFYSLVFYQLNFF
jgi:hypothetical protein